MLNPAYTAADKDIAEEIHCSRGGVCRISNAAYLGKSAEELNLIQENIERMAGEICRNGIAEEN